MGAAVSAVLIPISKHPASYRLRHYASRHQLKLPAHLNQQHITPVNRHSLHFGSTGYQWGPPAPVHKVDNHRIVLQVIDLEWKPVVVASHRGCVDYYRKALD